MCKNNFPNIDTAWKSISFLFIPTFIGVSFLFIFNRQRDISNATEHTNFNSTQGNEVFWLFRISFMYYSVIGFLVTLIVSQIVSLLTGGASQKIDESLLTPLFQSREFKEKNLQKMNETKYVTIDRMLIELTKQNHNNNNSQHNSFNDNVDTEMIQYDDNPKST